MDPAVIERVRFVMQESGLTQAEFAAEIATTPDKLSKSLGGARKFTVTELALTADLAEQTLDWLLKGEVEAEWRLAARSLEKDGTALESAHRAVQRFAEANEQAHLLTGATRVMRGLPVATNKNAVAQGKKLADDVVAALGQRGYLMDRIADLAGVLEDVMSVDIARVPIPEGLNGCALSTESLRLVMIGTTPHSAQQRFTLAHECGHIAARDAQNLIAEEVDGSSADHSEKRANSFAAHLLVPTVDLYHVTKGRSLPEAFDHAVSVFRVSPSMMYYRFLNEGLFAGHEQEVAAWGSETYESCLLRQGLSSRLSSERDESLANRIPPRLVSIHQEAFFAGRTSARPLANLLGVDPEEVIRTYRSKAVPA